MSYGNVVRFGAYVHELFIMNVHDSRSVKTMRYTRIGVVSMAVCNV